MSQLGNTLGNRPLIPQLPKRSHRFEGATFPKSTKRKSQTIRPRTNSTVRNGVEMIRKYNHKPYFHNESSVVDDSDTDRLKKLLVCSIYRL